MSDDTPNYTIPDLLEALTRIRAEIQGAEVVMAKAAYSNDWGAGRVSGLRRALDIIEEEVTS